MAERFVCAGAHIGVPPRDTPGVPRREKRHEGDEDPPAKERPPWLGKLTSLLGVVRGHFKAWSDPAFRAGASERALKAAATRRQRKQAQRTG